MRLSMVRLVRDGDPKQKEKQWSAQQTGTRVQVHQIEERNAFVYYICTRQLKPNQEQDV